MLGRNALKCLEEEAANSGDGGEPPQWIPHEPHPKQAEFLKLTCREALFGGAASGGKSDALLMAALQYVDVPGYNALLLRRTFRELALPEALMARARDWLFHTPAHWSGLDNSFRFPSGATLTFGYLENESDLRRYQSAAFSFIGWDELTHFEERQYRYMFSRCRIRVGLPVPPRIRGATNPGGIGHDWVKKRWGIPDEVDNDQTYVHAYETRKGERTRVFVPSRRVDNPSVDQDEYDEMLEELDDVSRMQLDEGKWIRDPSGLVYSSWDDDKNTTDALPHLPEDEKWCKVLGCDFGERKPTAYVELWFTQHDPNVYVVRSQQWKDMSPSESAEEARRWEDNAGGYDMVVGDTGGMGAAFETEWRKRFYLPMTQAKKPGKLAYIKLLNGDFHHGRVMVLPGNDELVRDVRSLPWKNEVQSKEHPNMPNHLPDALLYGWREARHWLFEERPVPKQGADLVRQKANERKEKVKARIRRVQEGNEGESQEWIWND